MQSPPPSASGLTTSHPAAPLNGAKMNRARIPERDGFSYEDRRALITFRPRVEPIIGQAPWSYCNMSGETVYATGKAREPAPVMTTPRLPTRPRPATGCGSLATTAPPTGTTALRRRLSAPPRERCSSVGKAPGRAPWKLTSPRRPTKVEPYLASDWSSPDSLAGW